jgi:CubicO group peptidase (beta-lactamase class C family)
MRTPDRPSIQPWAWMTMLTAILTSASVLALPLADVDGIDQLMRRSHARGIFNGNVLVARQGRIVYEHAFGYADATLKVPLTLNHRFNIGSITKEFSAVAIMMLQEQGRLTIEDTVATHLPGLPSWAAGVSIRNLLDYTSGIPDINWDTVKSDADVRADLMRVSALEFEPGSAFSYSNNNVSLRQFIVERITGPTFNRYVMENMYRPCGMDSSTLNPPADTLRIAKSFNNFFRQDPTDVPITGVVYATAGDVYKWTQCLHSDTLIGAKALSALGHSFKPTNGGLGRTEWNGDALALHEHDGQSRNFEALMTADLRENVTVILMSNNKNLKLDAIAAGIRAVLRGEVPTPPWGS